MENNIGAAVCILRAKRDWGFHFFLFKCLPLAAHLVSALLCAERKTRERNARILHKQEGIKIVGFSPSKFSIP